MDPRYLTIRADSSKWKQRSTAGRSCIKSRGRTERAKGCRVTSRWLILCRDFRIEQFSFLAP